MSLGNNVPQFRNLEVTILSRFWCKPVSMLGLILLWALSANAQVTTADVVGTVHDPTGAVIANANVAITNVGTGLTRTTQTSTSGDFVINLLPPGTYSVKVEAPSFKTFRV